MQEYIAATAKPYRIKWIKRLLIVACLSTAAPISASEPFQYDPSAKVTRKEGEVQIPSYPEDRNLIPVPLSRRDTLKLFIDEKSLSRDGDNIARFSLVVETSGGARNVFYEAMRCDAREYKTYALGTGDRSFQAIKEPKWQGIPFYETNAFRHHLYNRYVCRDHAARSPNEMVHALIRSAVENE